MSVQDGNAFVKKVYQHRRSPPPELTDLQSYSVNDACLLLRTSRATVYAMMRRGELEYFEFGKRRRIPGSEIKRVMAS